MVGDADELPGDLVRREDEVDRARADGRARHAVEARRLVLREGDASLGLDDFDAARAVRRGAGEHDADGAAPLILGERLEEEIDRQRRARLRRAEVQHPAGDRQIGLRRRDVDVVDEHFLAVGRLGHGERRDAREDLRDPADPLRLLMLDDDDGDAGTLGEVLQQQRNRFDPAGRGAHADDREDRAGVLLQRIVRRGWESLRFGGARRFGPFWRHWRRF